MFASSFHRWVVVALATVGLAACHHSETPAAAALPANPAVVSAAPRAVSSPVAKPVATAMALPASPWKAVGTDPAKTDRETAVGNDLIKKYPRLTLQRLDEVATGGDPIYYVMASGQIFYTNAKVDYLVQGGQLIIGVGDHVHNITEQMQQSLAATIYQKLPFAQSIKHVYGHGDRQLVMFSDPDCPVCQAFEKALDSKGPALNATIYTFPLPLLAVHPDSVIKATYLLCTPDPGAAWHDWMIHADDEADTGWATWTAKNKSAEGCPRAGLAAVGAKLAQQLGLSRTPTLIFPNGTIIPGAPTLDQMESIWALPNPPAL